MDSKLILIVCRELTKKFETIYRGEIGEVIKEIKKGETRGEFVVVLGGKSMIK
jgi:16S rRNA (cytidine1402-2'-O)-methyltransferase